MILVFAFTSRFYGRIALMPVLVIFRMASVLYFSIFLRRKYIIAGGVCVLLTWLVLGDIVTLLILDFNSNEMVFRD